MGRVRECARSGVLRAYDHTLQRGAECSERPWRLGSLAFWQVKQTIHGLAAGAKDEKRLDRERYD